MLRGLASLGVCIMHLTATVQSKFINEIGYYGGYGVPIFFVISGFIIPYSLFYSSYRLYNFPNFILKRIIRLDPPYLLSIAGIFLLSFITQFSSFHSSDIIDLFNRNTLYHLFYLVGILHGKWLNPVFWTLAIEFQFYIFIGIIFPLLVNGKRIIQLLVFLFFCLIPFFLNNNEFVPEYLLMFLPGILLFFFITKKINWQLFALLGIITLLLSYFKTGIPGIACPIIATCFILFVKKPIKPLIFLGTISYSLYLIHTPFGTDGMINFLQNYIVSESGRIWLVVLSLPMIIFIAWIFYRLIEKPSIIMAGKIQYRKKINYKSFNKI